MLIDRDTKKYCSLLQVVVFLALLFMAGPSRGQIITVKQDGSGDFAIIQDAVNAAVDGDTVLVWPGTYIENIRYHGKGITLGSLQLTTGDPSYIDQTVIDGNSLKYCVFLDTIPTHSVLQGFTVTNGGLLSSNRGSGIFVRENSSVEINYCNVKDNLGRMGGGIFIENSIVTIFKCKVYNNTAKYSGGGVLQTGENTYVLLTGNSIYNNQAYEYGGGLTYSREKLFFDTINLNSIYNNYGCPGSDIWLATTDNGLQHIVLDTFTVDQPDMFHAYTGIYDPLQIPVNEIEITMQYAYTSSVNSDLYVSPSGNDTNTGTSPDQPLQLLTFALSKIVSDSMHPNTIYLAPGTYSPSGGERFPLSMRSYVSVEGTHRDSVILDMEQKVCLSHNNYYKRDISLKRFTLTNGEGDFPIYATTGGIWFVRSDHLWFEDLLVTKNNSNSHSTFLFGLCNNIHFTNIDFIDNCNTSTMYAGGDEQIGSPFFSSDTVYISNCRFIGTQADTAMYDGSGGAGLGIGGTLGHSDSLNVIVQNCEFTNNLFTSTPGYLSVIAFGTSRANADLVNCTFSNNHCDSWNTYISAADLGGKLNVYNSIFYDSMFSELLVHSNSTWSNDTTEVNIYNSLVEGGEEDIEVWGPWSILHYDPTNIDTDPMFYGEGAFPYSLQAGSPCIDAGTLKLPAWFDLYPYDLAGQPRVYGDGIDMGAYEWGPWVKTPEPVSPDRPEMAILNVYPNPFRYGTYIDYELKRSGYLEIKVYDQKGTLQRILFEGIHSAGEGNFYWDGSLPAGQLPSGTYILSLTVNQEAIANVKVIKR